MTDEEFNDWIRPFLHPEKLRHLKNHTHLLRESLMEEFRERHSVDPELIATVELKMQQWENDLKLAMAKAAELVEFRLEIHPDLLDSLDNSEDATED